MENYSETSYKILKRVTANIENDQSGTDQANDPDGTETEGSDEGCARRRSKVTAARRKTKPTKRKGSSEDEDLIEAIRNKRENPFAAIGARYGVSMEDDDPLDDATFTSLQAKHKRKK